ncbi:MAG: hypothetical protein WBO46_15955 [Caldilineaceae bacterium]
MAEAGGPTTQSGILYQNSVAALYLGRLLDVAQRPISEQVVYVRIEAPEEVDDTVVRFADEHCVYIQAKERIISSSQEWSTLWKHFDKQFRDPNFQQGKDRLLLQIGNWRDEHDYLREMCQRSRTSEGVVEWTGRLTQMQKDLLKKIESNLSPSGLSEEYLLRFLSHIDVEIITPVMLERDYIPHWMPRSNRTPHEIFQLLYYRTGGAARVRGQFTASGLRESLHDENGDIHFDTPPDIENLQAALLQSGSLLRQYKHTFADTGVHLEREVVKQIVEWLLVEEEVEKNVAMLLDQAGMGKTVVMHDVLEQLENQGIAVLAIKADQQLSNITTLAEIQSRLALPSDVRHAISRLAQLNRVVILIDQIDALSLSLAHDQSTLDITLDFVARLRRIPNVRVLLSCRIFDRNTDPRLKNIDLGQKFSLQSLSVEDVNSVLANLGIAELELSQATRQLLCIPLHLDLFARIVANRSTHEQLRGITSLQELYALIWQNVILKQEVAGPPLAERVEVLSQLTRYMDRQQRTSAPQAVLQTATTVHLQRAVNWLASAGILLDSGTEWTFLHQTFFDYCYARQFVDNGGDIVSVILESGQGIFERPKLIQVIAYLRGSDSHRYTRALQQFFNSPELRFHLYDLLLRWFGSQPNPTDDEWLIASQILGSDTKRWQMLDTMYGNVGWFARLCPRIEEWLSSGNEAEINRALSYLTSLVEIAQAETVAILRPYIERGDEWCQRIRTVLSRIQSWHTEDAIKLYEKIIYKQPVLNQHTLWQLEDIADASPQAGCRIIRHVFDTALAQTMAKHPPESGQSAYVSVMEIFDEFHLIERDIGETLTLISTAEPELFVEKMLPWAIEVVTLQPEYRNERVIYQSDALSRNWFDDIYRVQFAFIRGLTEALIRLAQDDSESFRAHAEYLAGIGYQTPQQLLTRVYCSLPELYCEDAHKFLIADPRRLDIGHSGEQYDSRQLISAIYPFLTRGQASQLESHILAYAPIYKFEGIHALRWRGIEQYRLLHAIPEQCRSTVGEKRYKEWQRKFVGYSILDEPRVSSGFGAVGSPIDENYVVKMSDRSWLRAMQRYKGSIEHRDFLKGGARELATALASQIKANPERFYRLFQRVPQDVDDAYITAFINGFADSLAPNDWLFEVIERFAIESDRDIKRPVARAIEKYAKADVPDRVLATLIEWLRSPMGDDERWWSKGDNHGDVYSNYLNSDRGAALGALMRILDAQNTPEARERKWNLLEFVATDPSTALRIGAIHELTYMIRYDRTRAWSLFEKLIAGHEVLLETQYVREFIYWCLYQNFTQVAPYIRTMMNHNKEKVQEMGAELACIAAISNGVMESENARVAGQELADQILCGKSAWRRGAAHIYGRNMTAGSESEIRLLCETKVCQLIDDENSDVRERIRREIYGMQGKHFFERRRFMEEYALSELQPLDHQFSEYLWENGMQDPEWSLVVVQSLLQKKEHADEWRSGIEELLRLVLRIYMSPAVKDATKQEALDTFDLLMQQSAGIANKVLMEWDSR